MYPNGTLAAGLRENLVEETIWFLRTRNRYNNNIHSNVLLQPRYYTKIRYVFEYKGG